jgi:23S rRNA pseudouridine2605 synthase
LQASIPIANIDGEARMSRKRRSDAARRGERRPAVSLERALSKLGMASRPEARALVLAGRVRVGRRTMRDPGHRVDLDRDAISVDGRRVQAAAAQHWLVNKPPGYVTTRRDPDGRPTVYALLPPGTPHMGPVGRLDLESRGLLLLTNDTRLAAFLTDPASHVDKVYEVELDGEVPPEVVSRLASGVVLQGRRTLPAKIEAQDAGRSRFRITLHEGRNRQIRRMFESVGRTVLDLCRVRIGPLAIEGLGAGQARSLRAREIAALHRLRGGSGRR